MHVSDYLVAELDDTVNRLRSQILDIVPLDQQLGRLPGANSVTWITFHVARHAALALSVVNETAGILDPRLDAFDARATRGGSGLHEVQQPFTDTLDSAAVNAFAFSVFADVRSYLETLTDEALDALPDVETALDAAGVEHDTFDWLYRMWADQPIAFLVRWPLTGHLTHHVGELTGLRNQMGLSPFR
ncbi:hypothetical protein [Subtercola lobariae]|uniref:DinB-like domain-containing protein n=1 Tax=Subtercola lobariae TaxID=1588641 RepID=A0A917B6B3_9MICO|nr:hypothetical protein [Subtercola lobariae]GGF20855.1 hypothetical protein GCM10011399_13110 [Subtercola lobariae]